MTEDTRNVVDEFKGMSHEDIVRILDERGSSVEIAIENTIRDYNMGSIVRTANAFGVRTIHIVGRKQWNKRGAMMTDKYLHVRYHEDFAQLHAYANEGGRSIIAVDNVSGSVGIDSVIPGQHDILLFGQEGPGLSLLALRVADKIVAIEQCGSTRSLNVAVAAGIVLHRWVLSTS